MKNVVLITIDCLRADHVSCYGYERKTTPFIDSLAEKGARFENFFANGPFTPAAFPAIFSSTLPLDYEGYTSLRGRKMLAEILSKNNINTFGLHRNSHLSAVADYKKGFSYFEDFMFGLNNKTTMLSKIKLGLFRQVKTLIGANRLFKKIRGAQHSHGKDRKLQEKLKKLIIQGKIKEPFFLWIHYLEPHWPYTPPEKHFSKHLSEEQVEKINEMLKEVLQSNSLETTLHKSNQITETQIKDIIALYDDSILYTDNKIKELFALLEQENLLKNTDIIITADHGEEFKEHGGVFHYSKLYNEVLHIPLIICGPSIGKDTRSDLTEQLQIAPTVLELFGIKKPNSFRGEHLFKKLHKDGIFIESAHDEKKMALTKLKGCTRQLRTYAYKTNKWKYILNEFGDDELYNLEEDPKEQKNIILLNKEVASELKNILENHINARKKEKVAIEKKVLTDKLSDIKL